MDILSFKDRQSSNPNRRTIKIIEQNSDTIIADVDMSDFTEETGTPINASVMSNFQQGIIESNTIACEAKMQSQSAFDKAGEAETTATNALGIANISNTKSDNAVSTAEDANTKATNAVDTSDAANSKSDNAITIANEAKTISSNSNTKADSAVTTANEARTISVNASTKADNAFTTSEQANTKATNAVNTSDAANTKADNAVSTANEAKTKAEEALNQVVQTMGTKIYLGSNTTPESSVTFSSNPQSQIDGKLTKTFANLTNKSSVSDTDIFAVQEITNNTNVNITFNQIKNAILNSTYPIGSIYMSVNSTNPQTLFGGTWVQLQDRFLLGAGTIYSNGAMGGSKDAVAVSHNHTITQNVGGTIGYGGWGTIYGSGYTSAPGEVSGNISMEENYNNGIGNWAGGGDKQRGRNVYARFRIPDVAIASAGESGDDKNMPPYLVVYMWKRTA